MTPFDPRTEYLFLGLLHLILAAAVWIALARQLTLGVKLWCWASVVSALGMFLVVLRGTLADFLTFTIATLLLFSGVVLKIHALRADLGVPGKLSGAALGALAFMATFEYLREIDSPFRFGFALLVMAYMTTRIAIWAWRLGLEQDSSNALWISRVFSMTAAVQTLVLLSRLISNAMGDGTSGLLGDGFGTFLLPLTILISTVVSHIGYVGIALERSIQGQVKAALAQGKAEESFRLGEQIALLDRRRSLGEMSASLGHELNQPLAAILTNAQVARRGLVAESFGREQILEFLDKIVHNTQRASGIIERIRSFIRPAASRRETVDLEHVVRDVAALVAGDARARQIDLLFAPMPEAVRVPGDSIQLSQIVLNVFRNAIEAVTRAPVRQIHIDLFHGDGGAVLRVGDTGPGFSPEALALAGTPFFTTKEDGLGVGLSISRSIAEQHGGTLNIANAREGGGRIELKLPLFDEKGAPWERAP